MPAAVATSAFERGAAIASSLPVATIRATEQSPFPTHARQFGRRSTWPRAHAGVHAGPVIERDNDVYGATVITAARIGTMAAAGEILVSDAVRSECDGATGFVFTPRGEVALKGIGTPISGSRSAGPEAIREPAVAPP